MQKELYSNFLNLVRLGINYNADALIQPIGWIETQNLAEKQGLNAVVLDGIEKLSLSSRPPQELLLEWIGGVLQDENQYVKQWETACKMSSLFYHNYIRTYVLKGFVIAECYPNPKRRLSSDFDCYLLPVKGDFDAWDLGNQLISHSGYEAKTGYYKNSTFYLPDLMVENHQYITPFRGNKRLRNMEKFLQSFMRSDKGVNRFEGSYLYRPPVLVSALFIIEHAYSHFLSEGLTWRHILDWMLFSNKHKDEIEWDILDTLIDEYGLRKFYDSYYKLGQFLLGDVSEKDLSYNDRRMLEDVWADLDIPETLHGAKGKLILVGNTWRARWKYHLFSEKSMLSTLLSLVVGYLFNKKPSLD